jgi:hypothetical protein
MNLLHCENKSYIVSIHAPITGVFLVSDVLEICPFCDTCNQLQPPLQFWAGVQCMLNHDLD